MATQNQTDNSTAQDSNTQKDPLNWKTGDEPMTGAQRSYLHTLASEAHTEVSDGLTKAQASEQIDQLRSDTVENQNRADDATTNTQKDPTDWKTGDEPMTGAQRSYLQTLSDEAGEPFDDALTKAQASERIEVLKRRNPRISSTKVTR